MSTQKQYKYTLPIGYRLQGGENVYVIEEVLGKGGFGVTYKVKARVLYGKIMLDAYFALKEYFPEKCWRGDDNVTLKVPPTMHDEVANGIKDFLNEGRKLQQVCDLNPHIVNVNEVFEANGTAYYVLEYLEGGDLRKMVRNNGGPLTEQQMLDVMVSIGHAVQCLHDNNILHLDIKPDNIVMRRNSDGGVEPVLIDFGIAVHFNQQGTPTSKTPSQGLSPGYSPIEQYMLVKAFDPRIDVYAYCATCLYLLTGRDPREASLDLPADYVTTELPTTVSRNVAQAIAHGMSMNKSARTASINGVLAEFAASDEATIAVPPEKPQAPPKPSSTVNLQAPRLAPKENRASKPALTGNSSKPSKGKYKKSMIAVAILLAIALLAGLVLLSKRCGSTAQSGSSISIVESGSGEDDIIGDDDVETIKVTDNVSIKMVKVLGGTFTMGATSEQGSDAFDEEKPAHSVTLSSYYIGQTEVTQDLWEAVMGENPSEFKGAERPVENVSWFECQEFINKLNSKTGKNFRLPTEAEWEYAARGGNKSQRYKYSGSNTLSDVAWYWDNSGSTTHDVATKRANELGIYDMSGNVWEWCSDNWYNYDGSSTQYGSDRIDRGGCWYDLGGSCRVSFRRRLAPGNGSGLGVRLAL